MQILAINTKVRNACIAGDLHAAEELLTQEIDTDPNNYSSYANRSFVVARKLDWERALHHAVKSVSIQPSLIGYISKGIALCRQQHFQDAMKAIDLAFMFTDGDSNVAHFLLLIKAILMFNGNQHDDAMMRVQELADACPDADTLACRVVEAYLLVQLGTRASDDARHNEAADHFAAAIKTGAFSSGLAIHSIYEDLVVLFGWDLKILWQTTNQKRCHALLQAGKLEEAVESYRYMMDMSDDSTKADCLHWSTDFTQECSVLCAYNGDTAHEASNYDRAIDLYSAAIKLDSENDIIFEKRSRAKLGKMLWEEALLDAQKVVELNPSSHIGYQLKREALHGAHRYDEAIDAFQIMLSKMDNAPETHIRKLRQQYLSPSEVEDDIRNAIHAQLDDSPLRLLNTSIGRLCDRDAQMNIFKASTQYKELLSLTMKHEDLHLQHIEEAVGMYFRCVMLSHRWEKKEPLLHDIQEKAVYELDPVGGIIKLQSFCKIVRELGYHWAWSDTCCIDKINHVELQESLNSMFVWYRHSALTIVYLSDVPPSSKSGALARSVWNTRGWTVPEFLAPKVILFYQNDWSPYLDDRSPNHKESVAIMQELGDATGIHPEALVAFQAGMSGAREKLKWASTRVTTRHEDIAYSLFGVFGVRLPVDYGEKKEMALGRLLQEIVAQSGDITALDWVGKSSEFNSCLPADITSYQDSPCTPSSLSEDDIRTSVSSLQNIVAVELASKLYTMLDNLSSPRFTNRRLHLPCITFSVTEIRRLRHGEETYRVQADGLHDLLITTEDKLISFSVARPLSAGKNFLLVCPWNRSFLELSDPADDRRSIDDLSVLEPPLHDSFGGLPRDNEPIDMESHPRALRLIVRLGQPFSAFLLARQLSGEYKRIASDRHIIAQIKDMASIHDMMGSIRTLEIS
ncbi:hypothetical protein DFH29DRAFT_212618 [Suillus ampliporus]|nr:hypothetical protein DFH29DRAFT_212618 [Suillus ampliporus]